MIPFLDLQRINAPYKAAFQTDFNAFIDSRYYVLGNAVKTFESEFAAYCRRHFCIGVGNGLEALKLILRGYIELGRLAEGDRVIVAANTYIATILAVKSVGLEPVFVEPDEESFNLDPEAVKQALSPKVKAILVTHLYGQLADMQQLSQIALKESLLLLADAAQAHGARYADEEQQMNSLADAVGYSFYPTKNLGALGDAGAVTTDDKALAEQIKMLRNYGSLEKYKNKVIGYNSRLDELQAAFLSTKLKDLERHNTTRRHLAKQYLSRVNNPKIRLPFWDGTTTHVFHLFVVRVSDRANFCRYLAAHHIGYLIHYPIPPHQQEALAEYADLQLPITEAIHREVVSLPLHPFLTDEEIAEIISVLNAY